MHSHHRTWRNRNNTEVPLRSTNSPSPKASLRCQFFILPGLVLYTYLQYKHPEDPPASTCLVYMVVCICLLRVWTNNYFHFLLVFKATLNILSAFPIYTGSLPRIGSYNAKAQARVYFRSMILYGSETIYVILILESSANLNIKFCAPQGMLLLQENRYLFCSPM